MKMYVKNGEIYLEDGTCISAEPAIMFDKVTGTLHKYGTFDDVAKVYNAWCKADEGGVIIRDIIVLKFSAEKLSCEEIIDILQSALGTCDYCLKIYKDFITN